jgi:hypothetical protein
VYPRTPAKTTDFPEIEREPRRPVRSHSPCFVLAGLAPWWHNGEAAWASGFPSPEIGCDMQNLLRAAAEALAHLAEKAHQWADRTDDWAAGVDPDEAGAFAGVDLVGIDFSTSIQRVARHVIHGWDRYRRQVDALKPDHGVQVFGVNALPFPLSRRPLPPRLLPGFREEQFRQRGDGPGLIEYGSAFYDYFLVALGLAQRLTAFEGPRIALPLTISLLCDGLPNGGVYRADDARPLIDEARARGVRFKVVAFSPLRRRAEMAWFQESLGLTREEMEVAWYDDGAPDARTIDRSFDSLSHFF